jgi:hypothetical protein
LSVLIFERGRMDPNATVLISSIKFNGGLW